MTRCPSCQNENADGVPYCDMCGFDLAQPKRAPVAEAIPSPQGQPPAHPHQKRHTVFEPEAAPPPSNPRPAAPDYFSRPPPPRPPLDPRDPFGASVAPPPVPQAARPAPAPASPGGDVRAQKSRTIVEGLTPESSGGPMVRAALFEYRGPTDTGRVHALRVGRNTIGRDEGCDVVVQDGRVSGQHAFLFIRAEDATFVDVSSNGSVVNGTAIHGEQVVLQNHAVLGVGGTTLVLAMIPEQLLARRAR